MYIESTVEQRWYDSTAMMQSNAVPNQKAGAVTAEFGAVWELCVDLSRHFRNPFRLTGTLIAAERRN